MTTTPKQLATLVFIRAYIRKHGQPPTLREIADRFNVSTVTIHERIHAMEALGILTITPHKSRSIRLVGEPGTCPLCKQKVTT